MTNPEISVVMGIHNEAGRVARTVQSVVTQHDASFEFIIVDDGSTDAGPTILQQLAEVHPCIRFIRQSKGGLTSALIKGCLLARGDFIARQDAGDISLPGRLARQLSRLQTTPGSVMCSTAVETIAPDGEVISRQAQTEKEAKDGLKRLSLETIKGPPHHGSVMFRRDIYEKVGGYRPDFIVAQDLDLWTRMVELGDHYSVPDVMYRASADKNSISTTRRDQQFETASYVIECCHARKVSGSDALVLDQLREHNKATEIAPKQTQSSNSDFYYFIGSSLIKSDRSAGRKYLIRALKANPFKFKAWLKLLS